MTAPPPFAAIPPRGLPELKEHDACALAAFATRDGRPSRAMLERALTSLRMMVHRSGSVNGEGDGSGLMVDLPRPTWRRRLEAEGLDPAPADDRRFTVAHIFFDSTAGAEGQVPRILAVMEAHGFGVLWSGEGTVDRGALGPRAAETPPIFWQIACLAEEPGAAASRACYRAMVEIERDVNCHVASFSANDAVYKVQGQPEVIPRFYPEMQEPDFASSRIIAHNRYSTNTYPTFSRVQPFSILGHNGEINTIAQLREQSEQLGLPITRDGSDSQDLNRLLEGLIFGKGLSLLEAVEFALPPILGEVHRLPAKLQDLYVHYREALGPYAQGPVALASRAGDEMVFSVDAMGLRPLWWIETDELYVVSSEPGIVPVAELTRDPAPLAPGEKIALLTGEDGVPAVLDYWELQREVYRRAKGRGALPTAETRARLAGGLEPVAVEEYPDEDLLEPELELETLLASAGWIESDKQQLQFHADRGAEPIGSLGWDGPLGPFTPVPMPLSDYLQETVAVVTNPAIDREREVEHFSTRVVLGRRPPIEGVEPEPPQRCELRMPIILGGMRAGATTLSLPEVRRVAVGQGVACMEDVLAAWDWRAVRLPLHFSAGLSVREHLAGLSAAAVTAVRDGAELLVLQDLDAGPGERVCDPHLAVAAVDRALREATDDDGLSLRRNASVVLQAAGIRNVHDVMVALGFGAQALCTYAMMEKAMDGSPEPTTAAANVLEGLQKGMEKVLSTLGIHELRGYGRLVSAIGVSPEVLDVLAIPGFCASEGRGLGLDDLDGLAEQGRQIRAGEESPSKVKLPRMYPKVWKALARVATSERGYEELAETLGKLEDEQPVALRHAVQPQLAPPEQRIAAESVSAAVGEHTLPFLISSMSFGSQGETAFRAYAEAAFRADMLCMNGEGGEIPDMYGRYPKHRGQQVASGRFGVSSLLLNSSEWIEIKIGQGAKPGEGGHLPGSKVTQAIARARNAQVGSDLISPSNNHDLYSIEDLAQLIDELKTSNPHARVIVKVPVVPGIGTIAIGIAKAGADVITMSGYDGGTGAARQHALRRAGLPCEIGTVLAHHALTEAGIRDRVEIWADGGLRSAADCIKLICMGANRLGLRDGVDGRHRLHDLPRLPARHLPRRHRHPDRRRGGGRRARPQALRAAGARAVGRGAGALLHRDGGRAARARRPDGGLRGPGAGRPGGPPRAGLPPPAPRPVEPAHARARARHHVARRHAAVLPRLPPAAAAPRSRGRRAAARLRRGPRGGGGDHHGGRPQPRHRPGRPDRAGDDRRQQRVGQRRRRRRLADQRGVERGRRLPQRRRQRRRQRPPRHAGGPRLHQGRGGRERPGRVHPRRRARAGLRRGPGRRGQVRARRGDPGAQVAQRGRPVGRRPRGQELRLRRPARPLPRFRATPTRGRASACRAPTWCSAASRPTRSTTASARWRPAPTARGSRSST